MWGNLVNEMIVDANKRLPKETIEDIKFRGDPSSKRKSVKKGASDDQSAKPSLMNSAKKVALFKRIISKTSMVRMLSTPQKSSKEEDPIDSEA